MCLYFIKSGDTNKYMLDIDIYNTREDRSSFSLKDNKIVNVTFITQVDIKRIIVFVGFECEVYDIITREMKSYYVTPEEYFFKTKEIMKLVRLSDYFQTKVRMLTNEWAKLECDLKAHTRYLCQRGRSGKFITWLNVGIVVFLQKLIILDNEILKYFRL